MSEGQPIARRAGREALRGWYEPRRDRYPWRTTRDPYAVLVSEVMLQQTQAPRVVPAFRDFLARFPTVEALARAPRSAVVRAWSGLGYNRRAVALSEAARRIVREHDGRVPSAPAALVGLPGVGPYTAAAVASLAFGLPVAAVDTNVRRVVARFHLGVDPHDASPSTIRAAADAWLDRREPGSWNAAVMDLGREVCRPRPRCERCPLAGRCRFVARGAEPTRAPRRQAAFEGSRRQVRGAIVRALADRPVLSLAALSTRTGFELERVSDVLPELVADGLVRAGPGALGGNPSGRVRLAG